MVSNREVGKSSVRVAETCVINEEVELVAGAWPSPL